MYIEVKENKGVVDQDYQVVVVLGIKVENLENVLKVFNDDEKVIEVVG